MSRAAARPESVAKWHERMWAKAMDAQYDLIKEEVGKGAADRANYGWGDASDGRRIDVATKVYGDPCRILTTTADYPSDELEHDWGEY